MAESFEGDDLDFYRRLEKELHPDTMRDHRAHVMRILRSSPDYGSYSGETTLLRIGMRKSLVSDLQDPARAAALVESLIESLEAFETAGLDDEWFFEVLRGAATVPVSLLALARYASVVEGRVAASPPALARAPAGSDASEVDDERDAALSATEGSEYETAFRPARADDALAYMSTGEAYPD